VVMIGWTGCMSSRICGVVEDVKTDVEFHGSREQKDERNLAHCAAWLYVKTNSGYHKKSKIE